jgi:transcriptional regulator with XRE-family HTH domain
VIRKLLRKGGKLSFKQRLLWLIERHSQGNVSQFAGFCGLTESSVRQWIKGPSKPTIDKAISIVEACEVSLDWLFRDPALLDDRIHQIMLDPTAGSGSFAAAVAAAAAEYTFLPRLDLGASARSHAVAPLKDVDGAKPLIGFRTEWLRRIGVEPASAAVLIAVGDPMEPTIRDGDLVLIDRSIIRAFDDGIYLIALGGMVLLRRLQPRRDGSIALKSDNPVYDDELVPAAEVNKLRIEARVRWFGRTL